MSKLRIGFIGTGKKPVQASAQGYGMAHMHAVGYQQVKQDCEIVACADIVRENGEAFAEMFGVPKNAVYTSYHDMLAKEKLDIVSICTWPKLHAQMAIDAAKHKPKAIFCEKPMAYNFGDCKRMHQVCVENGTQLCFNHQRRYGKPFRIARKLIEEGAIGKLQRVEFCCGDIYDYGTHSFDLSGYLAGDINAKWVIAQIDYRELKLIFGAHCENQAIVQWEYQNGVSGFASCGIGSHIVNAHNKAVGSDGIIEIGSYDPAAEKRPLRIRKFGAKDWEYLDTSGEGPHGPGYIERAIADFIACVKENRTCELSSHTALKGTEIIFAAYQSARIRGRVDLPLLIEDHPLVEMVNWGELRPVPKPQ
ncbi:MAG TPA: Gfo/Idh/MocA family oxidoreductase [Planctomycetota bacterium]|nr:Gfo/Idh/MocA family oxidoreductase [Planctomycetota bacterium]